MTDVRRVKRPRKPRTHEENQRIAEAMRRLVPLLRADQKRLPPGI